MESTTTKTQIVLVSVPAFTHQISILEFAKRLLHLHNNDNNTFHITCIIPTLNNSPSNNNKIASKPFFDSLPQNIHCIFLPITPFDVEVSVEIQLQLSVSRTVPSVRDTVRSLFSDSANNVAALIVDAMVPEALEFGKELNVLSYIYFPCSTMVLSLCLHSQILDEQVSCDEYKDYPNLLEIQGCIPIHGMDLPNSFLGRSGSDYKLFLQRCQRYRGANYDGVLVNSFMELELDATKALSSQQDTGNNNNNCNGNGNGNCNYPLVYPIGPITQTRSKLGCDECLLWLDKQPPSSVIYVSFGSGGTLSQEQINELALGLELSRHKFLWVNFRAPNDRASATYLSDGGNLGDVLQFLPLGFLERITKGQQGLVMPGWGPQVKILSHKSVGAFLTHCGWNSILESVIYGVPMMAWPLFAEQRTNAALITDGLKVALRPKVNTNSVVVKEEIVELVKRLMEGLEGEEIRERVKELKKFAACAVMEDGSSTRTISKLANKWKSLGKPF